MRVMVREGLFTDSDPPSLLGSRCGACGSVHFPRADTCTYCATEDPEPVELSHQGTLWAWTAVTAPPPGYRGEVPYGIGVVELPEGLRVITRLTESRPGCPFPPDQADGAANRAPAPRRGRQRRRDLRLRPGAVVSGVVVAGVGLHPFGRFEGVSTTDMGVVAVRAALREAGVGKGGFQAAFCGTAYGGVATGHKVLSRLGMTGMPIVDVEAGCASGSAALMLAAAAIRAGQYDTVVVFGTEKMPKGIIRSSFFEPWQEEAGLAATPAYFGLRAQRLCRTSGVTKDHLARVVVKNRRHGSGQPRRHVPEGDVGGRGPGLACRVRAAAPLHAVLAQRGGGRTRLATRRPVPPPPPPVRLAAAVLRSHIPGPVLSESTPLSGLADDAVPAPTTLAATDAYEQAGLGPQDLDVVECQDTDAARELLSCEELGLCDPGGSAALLDSGATALGGRLPVNPSGGLLSKGEPLGASALGQVVELVRQLRGESGPRQVDGARTALSHTVGRGANAGVVILTR